jgi:amino acid transporter
VQAVLLGFTASNCIIFAKYTLFALSVEPTDLQHKALAVGLLTTIIIIHGRFLKTGIAIQNALGWVKIFLIGAMSLTGIWVLLLRFFGNSHHIIPQESFTSTLSWDYLWEGSNWSWGLLSTAIFKVMYSYAGLNNINNVLNEVQNPVQTVKTVCPSALLTAGGLYLLANTSYLLVVPIDDIKNSGELVAALLFERLFGDHIGRTLLPLAIAISAAGNVMVVTFAHVCLPIPYILPPSNNPTTGSSQSRNCSPGILTLAEPPFLLTSIWNSTWWSTSALYSIRAGHLYTATRRRLQFYLRCGGISRPALRSRNYRRSLDSPV